MTVNSTRDFIPPEPFEGQNYKPRYARPSASLREELPFCFAMICDKLGYCVMPPMEGFSGLKHPSTTSNFQFSFIHAIKKCFLRAPLLVISNDLFLGSTPWNSWWGCAARFSKSWPYLRPKHAIFLTPVFRPDL